MEKVSRPAELLYASIAFGLWSEVGPYKSLTKIREVRIQSEKLFRILSRSNDVWPSFDETLGERPSRQLLKRRGKVILRAERQYKKLLSCVGNTVQENAEQEVGRRLTNAELRETVTKFEARMALVALSIRQKYPILDKAKIVSPPAAKVYFSEPG